MAGREGAEGMAGMEVPTDDGTLTWAELLAEAEARLSAAGVEGATVDARRIVAEALGVADAELLLHLREPATARGVARFDDMLGRRSTGEPLQYVLGHWSFRSLDLMVDRRVLIPRPETEHVVDVVLAELDRLGGTVRSTTVVDLGTGSGAIALAVATERVRTSVWATDASADALDVARANLAGIGRAGARVRIAQGSWLAALPEELKGEVDLVVSNPPYVATTSELPADVVDWEPAGALFAGPDGTGDLRVILDGVGEWLTAEGVVVCELSPEHADLVAGVAADRFAEVDLVDDLTGRARAVVARRPLG